MDHPTVDILIPTYNRAAALAVTLTSLAAQTYADFRIIVSDQTPDADVALHPVVTAAARVLSVHGTPATFLKHLPSRGMAEHRSFLLEKAQAPYALFLDDDLILEPYVLANMVCAITTQGCGFVGSAVIGLSFIDDIRPLQQAIELWDGPVQPEVVRPGAPAWERYQLHNAANLYHVQQRLNITPDKPRLYRVAWTGGCVLYNVAYLRSVGGFSFWRELPPEHSGEDVLAQLRVMEHYGGCGIIPSGVYHQELQTTVPNREVDAPKTLEISIQDPPVPRSS